MNMSKYVRITKGLKDKGKLVKQEEVQNYQGADEDYYASVYYYTEEHKKQFEATGSIQGITDVVTDKLVLDFDKKSDVEQARKDAIEAVKRLKQAKINEKDIEIYFSGNKGFHVAVTLDRELTPQHMQSIALNKFGRGLATLDSSIYNPSRILRIPGTKHPDTHLYKVPISFKDLNNLTVDQIKVYAQDLENIVDSFSWEVAHPDEAVYELEAEQPKKEVVEDMPDLAEVMSKKPNAWKDYKWALINGFFRDGERHNALMVIAATCRAMGYDRDLTYYNCKHALYKSQERYGEGTTNKTELWKNIIEGAVFADNWKGGQYAPDENGTGTNRWLYEYCKKMGFGTKDKPDVRITSIASALDAFESYAKNIDANTIKTGLEDLDANVRFTIGSSYGIVGSPGSGKTTLAIQMLNTLSKSGQRGLFFSYDMFHAQVMQKLVQKHTGLTDKEIFEKFKHDSESFKKELYNLLTTEYANVDFCFQAGQTVADIVDTIKEAEQKSGQKVKLVVCDYNELVQTDMSDATASSSFVAQKMREIANVHEVAVVSLFQPNKLAGDPSDEIKNYRSAKGSSAIEQSLTTMLGISRPGFDPDNFQDDWIMTIRCLKNRMGPLFSTDLHWNGQKGELRDMTTEEAEEARELKGRIALRRAAEEESNGW